MPSVILASKFNQLRNRVNRVLGESTSANPTYGYGQPTNDRLRVGTRESSAIADKITAEDYVDLYIDLVKVKVHQVGVSNVTIEPFVVGDYENNSETADIVEEAFINSLEALATDIENNRFYIDTSTQASVDSLTNQTGQLVASTRLYSDQGSWNGSIEHIVDVTFDSVEARRHFFNAGGEMRFSYTMDYSGSQLKSVEWKNAGSEIGAVSFRATRTQSNNSVGTPANIGNYQLTSVYQLCYRYNIGGSYSNNYYEVYALELTQTSIRYKIVFVDGEPNDPRYGIDEQVLSDVTSNLHVLVPSGEVTVNGLSTNTVVIDNIPSGSIVSNL